MQQRTHLATWNQDKDFWEVGMDIFGHSVAYSAILPRSGMTRGGQLYELVTSEHPTTDPGSFLLPTLPTPAASDYKRDTSSAGAMRRKSPSLTVVDKHFPTQRTTDANGPGRHEPGGPDLWTVVAELSTGEPTDLLFEMEG